jgi:hypothetical protein
LRLRLNKDDLLSFFQSVRFIGGGIYSTIYIQLEVVKGHIWKAEMETTRIFDNSVLKSLGLHDLEGSKAIA